MVLKALSVFDAVNQSFLAFALDPQGGISIDSLERFSIEIGRGSGSDGLTHRLLQQCQNSLSRLHLGFKCRSPSTFGVPRQ
jgi:hypothetical protein